MNESRPRKELSLTKTDRYIESQLIFVSHDRLAQHWVGFGHINYFQRVGIDEFLKV